MKLDNMYKDLALQQSADSADSALPVIQGSLVPQTSSSTSLPFSSTPSGLSSGFSTAPEGKSRADSSPTAWSSTSGCSPCELRWIRRWSTGSAGICRSLWGPSSNAMTPLDSSLFCLRHRGSRTAMRKMKKPTEAAVHHHDLRTFSAPSPAKNTRLFNFLCGFTESNDGHTYSATKR